MIETFLTGVAPVFSVVLIGWLAARSGAFDGVGAGWINKFVFLICLSALLFRLVADAPLAAMPWNAAGAYLMVELTVMALGFLAARYGFRRSAPESLLIGMSAGFANHVFVVHPIAVALFGEEASRAILATMMIDAAVIFSLAILAVDGMRPDAEGAPLRRLWTSITTNPPILAILAGFAANLLAFRAPADLDFFLGFLGSAAPPASLFALGVVLAARAEGREIWAPGVVTALKLVAAPALVWLLVDRELGFGQALGVGEIDGRAAILGAAGPTGAMPFVLALKFGAPPQTITRAILISTAASAIVLSVLAAPA